MAPFAKGYHFYRKLDCLWPW